VIRAQAPRPTARAFHLADAAGGQELALVEPAARRLDGRRILVERLAESSRRAEQTGDQGQAQGQTHRGIPVRNLSCVIGCG